MTAAHLRERPGGPELVGRHEELTVLRKALEGAPSAGSALVLTGEPGIGKSSLLHAAITEAHEMGMVVLAATGVEAETALPFAGTHQLLRPLLGDVDLLPAAHRSALLRAFGVEAGPSPELFLVALAVLGLLDRAAARRPLLAAVDDLQWQDDATRRVLSFVARRLDPSPVVLMVTARSDYGEPLADADLDVLHIRPLDDDAARALVIRHGGHLHVEERQRILREALGNPLALVELSAVADSGEPPPTPIDVPITARIERAFAGRARELGRTSRDVLLVAALDAVDDLSEILAAGSTLAGERVTVAQIDAVVEAGLLQVDGTRVRFRHPLVRSAVARAEPMARHRAAHAALASILRDEPFRGAWHRAHSIEGLDDEIADELERSQGWALARGSGLSVVWALERAAQLTSNRARRGRRLLLAAEQAFGFGRARTVDRLIAEASRHPLTPVERARMAWLSEIFHDGVPGDVQRIRQLCEAAERAREAGDPDLTLNLLTGAALRCWWAGSPPEVRRSVVRATESWPELSRNPRYAYVLAVADPVGRCARVLEMLSVPADGTTDVEVLRYHGAAAHAVGDPVRAADLLDRAETGLRDQGRLALLHHVLDMQIQVRIELGDWGRAALAVEETRQLAPETGQPIWVAGSLVGQARLAALRGDASAAEDCAAQAERVAHGRYLTSLLACAQLARGTALCGAGRYADAYTALRRMFDPADPTFDPRERYGAILPLVDAAVRSGRREEARDVVAEMERVAAATPAALLAVHLLYARAVLADDTEADELFAAALDADLVRWPWMRSRLELAHGSRLRRQRRVAESREPLRAALNTLRELGGTPWAEEAAEELRAAGDPGFPVGAGSAWALTAREAHVARLAAEGRSNREIAARLNLSHRTVGAHLRNVYPKLGVTSRAQLRAALDRDA